VRAFLAIDCPKPAAETLESPRDALNNQVSFRPVDTDQFHLTVKFLGDTSQSSLDRLDREFRSRLPTPGPLRLTLSNVGVFPDPGSPSVAWVGVEQNETLRELYDAVEEIAGEVGYEPEKHDFQPHVTLGRFNNGRKSRSTILEWIESYGERHYDEFEARNLLLYESNLTPEGPEYIERMRWPL